MDTFAFTIYARYEHERDGVSKGHSRRKIIQQSVLFAESTMYAQRKDPSDPLMW